MQRRPHGIGPSARTVLLALLAVAVSIPVAAACGDDVADPTGADPTGADPTGADPTGADPTDAVAAADVRTVRCHDGDRTWQAEVADLAADGDGDGDGDLRIESVDPADGTWSIVRTDRASSERSEEALAATDLPGRELRTVDAPGLTTPDRRCTFPLAPMAEPGSETVVVIGDSLAAGIVATGALRDELSRDARDRGLYVTVDGQSGAPWASIDTTGGNLLDEIRGAASVDGIRAVVTVIGANDAILAAFPTGQEKAAQQARTDDAIRSAIDVLADVDCIVVTTPPAHPSTVFGLHDSYAVEALRVGDVLRQLADAEPRVVVADFARVSDAHHLADGTAGDWFDSGDELHPNVEGTRALRALTLDAVAACLAEPNR